MCTKKRVADLKRKFARVENVFLYAGSEHVKDLKALFSAPTQEASVLKAATIKADAGVFPEIMNWVRVARTKPLSSLRFLDKKITEAYCCVRDSFCYS